MSTLRTTLQHLATERPIDSSKTAVIIAPPMTEGLFNKHMKPKFWTTLFNKRPFEFIKQQALYIPNWEDYRRIVLLPLVGSIEIIKQTKANIIPEATWNDFCKALINNDLEAVFLVAHHQEQMDCIEFADGGRPIKEVLNFIERLSRSRKSKISLLLFVCESDFVKSQVYGTMEAVQSVSWSRWKIGFTDSLFFIAEWINALDTPQQTLTDAYQIALFSFVQSLKNNQNENS